MTKKICSTKCGDLKINTVYDSKQGQYITTIRSKLEHNWITVATYESEQIARIKHKYWVEYCEDKPLLFLFDIKKGTNIMVR